MSTASITESIQEANRIENYESVIESLEDMDSILPNGDRFPVEVDNPELSGKAPRFLRVSVYRKGMTFNVISLARSFGLEVTDVWQLDADKEADRIMFKLEQK